MDEFEEASCSRTFGKGEGLPGRVWASGEPAWILDIARDANFPRLAAAVGCGLHSAFACPVVVGDRTLGVIEFFTRAHPGAGPRPAGDDGDRGRAASASSSSGKRPRSELRRSEQELADFFENATVGLHWVGPDGTILRANRAELDMLGYSREEYVGRPIAEFHADEDVICDILGGCRPGEKLARLPGPPPVQGRVDQGRADRLQRDVAGRRVRPHPLLHPGRHRAEAGGGGAAGERGSGSASWPTPCRRSSGPPDRTATSTT